MLQLDCASVRKNPALAVGLIAILGTFVLLARRVRRTGVGGGIMGPIDEIYRPAAHYVRQQTQAHEERTVPRSATGDRSGDTSAESVDRT